MKRCDYDQTLKFLLEFQITLQKSRTFSQQKELVFAMKGHTHQIMVYLRRDGITRNRMVNNA